MPGTATPTAEMSEYFSNTYCLAIFTKRFTTCSGPFSASVGIVDFSISLQCPSIDSRTQIFILVPPRSKPRNLVTAKSCHILVQHERSCRCAGSRHACIQHVYKRIKSSNSSSTFYFYLGRDTIFHKFHIF